MVHMFSIFSKLQEETEYLKFKKYWLWDKFLAYIW